MIHNKINFTINPLICSFIFLIICIVGISIIRLIQPNYEIFFKVIGQKEKNNDYRNNEKKSYEKFQIPANNEYNNPDCPCGVTYDGVCINCNSSIPN